jgi:Zn-dependent M28 family amino/carboxypeptidase
MRTDVRFLSSDLLEGRAPGTRGDALAQEYIRAQMLQMGLKTSFQDVPLLGVETQPSTRIGPLIWLTDVVGHTQSQQTEAAFEFADVVFVGHGITAPEYGWDDYGDVAVRGKVVVLFTNEPPSEDPKFFGGPALTYYGRWTYKFEEAARRGAAAALIIHTNQTAGYSWDVVRSSWGREDVQVRRSQEGRALSFAGWITEAAAAKWLGAEPSALLAEANTPGFKARRVDRRIAAKISSKLRNFATRNVIGIATGSDSELALESVLFSAHFDHLGLDPQIKGDGIYNGAVDNASGVAVMLEMARQWMALDPAPPRSAVFVAMAAEEGGLRGSEVYAANPAMPLATTRLAMNFDSFLPLGRTRDYILTGADKSPYWPLIQHTVERFGLAVKPDPHPEQGAYFRSDHYSIAKGGVAAFSVNQGDDYVADGANLRKLADKYSEERYHLPGDEYREDWDVAGWEQTAQLGFEIGLGVANAPAAVPQTQASKPVGGKVLNEAAEPTK